MASFIQKAFLQSRLPSLQTKRFRGKINIQRPRQPHYERARVIAVTNPIFPEKPKELNCFEQVFKKTPENPYNKIIAKEVLNWLNHSSMVGIFHLNSISADELFKLRVQLYQQNMHLKSYGKKIIKMAVDNTKYEAILPLFDSQQCIVFSPEDKVLQLLRITKKCPQMILLGGIVKDTLMSKNEFTDYAKMPNLQTAQAQLVGILQSAAGHIVNNLEAHQKSLVNILDVHAKGNESSPSDNPAEGSNG